MIELLLVIVTLYVLTIIVAAIGYWPVRAMKALLQKFKLS